MSWLGFREGVRLAVMRTIIRRLVKVQSARVTNLAPFDHTTVNTIMAVIKLDPDFSNQTRPLPRVYNPWELPFECTPERITGWGGPVTSCLCQLANTDFLRRVSQKKSPPDVLHRKVLLVRGLSGQVRPNLPWSRPLSMFFVTQH